MRVEGWEDLLAEYLENVRPFAWGSNDCAIWSARWILLCTGLDLVNAWEGKYRSERTLKSLMRKRGYSEPSQIADAGLPAKPIAMAQRGDLTLYPNGALGICNGQMSHFLAEEGVIIFPTLECGKAWGVS